MIYIQTTNTLYFSNCNLFISTILFYYHPTISEVQHNQSSINYAKVEENKSL